MKEENRGRPYLPACDVMLILKCQQTSGVAGDFANRTDPDFVAPLHYKTKHVAHPPKKGKRCFPPQKQEKQNYPHLIRTYLIRPKERKTKLS